MVTRINVVASNPFMWSRNRTKYSNISFTYGHHPVSSALNVYISNVDGYLNPHPDSILLLTEPPEILSFAASTLSRFRTVVGPDFYHGELQSNHLLGSPLLPNFVGVNFPKKSKMPKWVNPFFSSRQPTEVVFLDQILNSKIPKRDILSVIISGKDWTPLQKQRREFVHYLREGREIQVEIFGDVNPIRDKYDSLKHSRWSLAIENSIHPHYFSEKLTDGIISGAHSFYLGAPNIADYFTDSCYTSIPLEDFSVASELILNKMSSQQEDFDFSFDQSLLNEKYSLQGWFAQNISKLV